MRLGARHQHRVGPRRRAAVLPSPIIFRRSVVVDVADDDFVAGQDRPLVRETRRRAHRQGREQQRHHQPAHQRGLPDEMPHAAEDALADNDGERGADHGNVPRGERRERQGQEDARQGGVGPPQQRRRPRDAKVKPLDGHTTDHGHQRQVNGAPAEKEQPAQQRPARRRRRRHQENRPRRFGGVHEGRLRDGQPTVAVDPLNSADLVGCACHARGRNNRLKTPREGGDILA